MIDAYLSGIESHPYYAKMAATKKFSMLHVEVLLLLRLFARAARGGILEIGPYIGGSSIAIGSGVRDGGGSPFVSVEHGGVGEELGGIYSQHPQIPSSDILGDLRRNLDAEGLTGFVTLIEGKSDAPDVVQAVHEACKDALIDLLFIDADGQIDRDLASYGSLLSPNALLVFDDYTATGAQGKELVVHAQVDAAVQAGRFESFGVYGWGTWIGRRLG
jgi:predicted O-methyltransferase YrrM